VLPTLEVLRRLLTVVADHHPPFAVGALSHPSGVALALHDLGADPVDELVGFVAPPDWDAFGLVAPGRATDLESGRDHPVVVTHLCDRLGQELSAIRSAGPDGPTVWPHPAPPEPVVGRVPDLCRRVLGLATPPPEGPPTELWLTQWLDRCLALAALAESPLTWEHLAALHPAGPVGAGRRAPGPDALAELAAAGARQASWRSLRLAAGTGTDLPVLTPEMVAWMDDGTFSRWWPTEAPPWRDLLGDLVDLLDHDPAARLLHCVATILDS
jgi:hypothetical protein